MASTENLSTEQTGSVMRFLLHRMSMDTRHELMAHLPVAYAALFPGVDTDALIARVGQAIAAQREGV